MARHEGPYAEIDRTYAALGSHAAAAGTAAGPIREIYLVGPGQAADEAGYRTEVCWPVT